MSKNLASYCDALFYILTASEVKFEAFLIT